MCLYCEVMRTRFFEPAGRAVEATAPGENIVPLCARAMAQLTDLWRPWWCKGCGLLLSAPTCPNCERGAAGGEFASLHDYMLYNSNREVDDKPSKDKQLKAEHPKAHIFHDRSQLRFFSSLYLRIAACIDKSMDSKPRRWASPIAVVFLGESLRGCQIAAAALQKAGRAYANMVTCAIAGSFTGRSSRGRDDAGGSYYIPAPGALWIKYAERTVLNAIKTRYKMKAKTEALDCTVALVDFTATGNSLVAAGVALLQLRSLRKVRILLLSVCAEEMYFRELLATKIRELRIGPERLVGLRVDGVRGPDAYFLMESMGKQLLGRAFVKRPVNDGSPAAEHAEADESGGYHAAALSVLRKEMDEILKTNDASWRKAPA